MHDLLATATFSRDEKRRGSKALGRNAVTLHIFHEKCADTPYISRKRRRTRGKKQWNVKEKCSRVTLFCLNLSASPRRLVCASLKYLNNIRAGLRVLGRFFLYFLKPPVYLMKALPKGERHSADVTYFLFRGWSVSAARHLQERLLISPFVSSC